ncbi:hypothetical protein OIDMADRAFT_175163 [Oidiodendron maius Zn]|uniref:Rhodopsin domain-containing protein n=1 Tax=Oidiodendron maius (strain Zn) TaxID=913774 RepID=A0A0C3HZR1_OIDMZ|nr:hypothetical protein OIDMADRAFT_175163 [Oidiodendron maius Zn]
MADFNNIPPVAPPPGITFDPNGPNPSQTAIIVMQSVTVGVMTIVVMIRIYTHAVIKKSMGLDDYLAILSWALAVTFSTVMGVSTIYGFGKHIYEVSIAEMLKAFKLITVTEILYSPVMLAIKSCLLVGFLRLFKANRTIKWLIWISLGLLSIFYTVTFLSVIFYCHPVQKSWDPLVPGHCINYSGFPWATGIFNIISDFCILFLPMQPVFKLSMKLGRRIRVASIFGLGLFTCVASIMRFVETIQNVNNPDQTYIGVRILYWAVLEINIGIICACATSFPAFFDASVPGSLGSFVTKLLTTRTRSSSASQTELTGQEKKNSQEAGTGRTMKGPNFYSRPSRPSDSSLGEESQFHDADVPYHGV